MCCLQSLVCVVHVWQLLPDVVQTPLWLQQTVPAPFGFKFTLPVSDVDNCPLFTLVKWSWSTLLAGASVVPLETNLSDRAILRMMLPLNVHNLVDQVFFFFL